MHQMWQLLVWDRGTICFQSVQTQWSWIDLKSQSPPELPNYPMSVKSKHKNGKSGKWLYDVDEHVRKLMKTGLCCWVLEGQSLHHFRFYSCELNFRELQSKTVYLHRSGKHDKV